MFSLSRSIKIRASKDIQFALRNKKKKSPTTFILLEESNILIKFSTCLSLHSFNNVNIIKLHLIF